MGSSTSGGKQKPSDRQKKASAASKGQDKERQDLTSSGAEETTNSTSDDKKKADNSQKNASGSSESQDNENPNLTCDDVEKIMNVGKSDDKEKPNNSQSNASASSEGQDKECLDLTSDGGGGEENGSKGLGSPKDATASNGLTSDGVKTIMNGTSDDKNKPDYSQTKASASSEDQDKECLDLISDEGGEKNGSEHVGSHLTSDGAARLEENDYEVTGNPKDASSGNHKAAEGLNPQLESTFFQLVSEFRKKSETTPDENEASLFEIVLDTILKRHHSKKTMSDLKAQIENLKAENSRLVTELEEVNLNEADMNSTMKAKKEKLQSLSSKLAFHEELRLKNEENLCKARTHLRSVGKKVSQLNARQATLKLDYSKLQKQLGEKQSMISNLLDLFSFKEQRESKEMEILKGKEKEQKKELECLERTAKACCERFDKKLEESKEKEKEIKFIEKKYGGLRSLYKNEVISLETGCGNMKDRVVTAIDSFKEDVRALECSLQVTFSTILARLSVLTEQVQVMKTLYQELCSKKLKTGGRDVEVETEA